MNAVRFSVIALAGLGLVACASPRYAAPGGLSGPRADLRVDRDAQPVSGTMRPYKVGGRWYYPKADPGYSEVGVASWYGPQHQGKPTATGEVFDQNGLSAAHKTLPLPSIVEVTNLENGRKIRVRVNDRGPFVDGRIIDLSKAAAAQLGMVGQGTAKVRVRYIGPAESRAGRARERNADARY